MSRATPATLALAKAGVAFEIATYDYAPGDQPVGLQAAEALGEPPARVFKTLIALVDDKPVCLVLPSDHEASLKKVAAAFGGKAARMAPPADAERMTGYKIGGVSPFGQKRRVRTALDASALGQPHIYINGGQRGLQVKLAPDDLRRAAEAVVVDILA